MGATIRDVANEAKVSIGTVSRFLNGYKLKDQNMKRIEEAIMKLDYKENLIAKGLRKNKTLTVGVVLGSIKDIFSTSIAAAIEQTLSQANYGVILGTYESSQKRLDDKIDFLLDRSIDGLVVFRGNKDVSVLEKIKRKMPVILVDDQLSEYMTVSINNSQASYIAINHLIENGHKRIGIINGKKDSIIGNERYAGYIRAFKDSLMNIDEDLVRFGDFGVQSGYDLMKEFLDKKDRPSAIYVTNYYMTIGALMAINERSITIPDELSFVGFDDHEIMEIFKTPLTIIKQPEEEIGKKVANLLLEQFREDKIVSPKHYEIDAELIKRSSVKKIT